MPESIVRSIESVDHDPVARSTGATIQVLLGPADGMPNFYTRLFTLEPGGLIPNHRHDVIEHEQFVLEGEMVVRFEGVEHVVSAGQAVYIPARVAHSYENRGDVRVRFLCMVPAVEAYGTEWIEER